MLILFISRKYNDVLHQFLMFAIHMPLIILEAIDKVTKFLLLWTDPTCFLRSCTLQKFTTHSSQQCSDRLRMWVFNLHFVVKVVLQNWHCIGFFSCVSLCNCRSCWVQNLDSQEPHSCFGPPFSSVEPLTCLWRSYSSLKHFWQDGHLNAKCKLLLWTWTCFTVQKANEQISHVLVTFTCLSKLDFLVKVSSHLLHLCFSLKSSSWTLLMWCTRLSSLEYCKHTGCTWTAHHNV